MILGIDIGSMAISAVLLDAGGQVNETFYEFHEGQPGRALRQISERLEPGSRPLPAITSSSRLDIKGIENIDIQTALVRAGCYPDENPQYILHVGAEKFYLIKLGGDGSFESSRTNTSCAAGTGSFLDQQARRLQIPSIEQFCRMAESNRKAVPEIASRCSVFAKTDLIHAQQEGHSTEAICDGLCRGLARNLADTLFHDFNTGEDILFTGGVSRNPVVARHLEELLGSHVSIHPLSHLFGALGAALRLFDRQTGLRRGKSAQANNAVPCRKTAPSPGLEDLISYYSTPVNQRDYFYPPLNPKLKGYPDFSSGHFRVHKSGINGFKGEIQVEAFEDIEKLKPAGIYMGIDIGSTSTKAIICSEGKLPLLGYYTYTSGKPIEAVFSIFEAFDRQMAEYRWRPEILGVGTTGSGRNLLGKILDADLVLDEITAHARAAVHLNPGIDTIIEIGGQDAKFSVLKEGEVVFSQMNAVCAAGTGSFIEEQAKKLGVALEDYDRRVRNRKSPLTSDRCTVFMERDLNYLVNRGYTVEELLAAVLHSVRENYFKKVAIEGMIGKRICFQGATARNRALVAAFEQKLDREIFVSRYCHLTGAMGVSLIMEEDGIRDSRFRGIEVYGEKVPVRTEICTLCNNQCKLTIASIADEEVAFGFMCGRDYSSPRYIARQKGAFNLVKEWNRSLPSAAGKAKGSGPVIGIPAALHMYEEGSFWEYFFSLLSIRTLTSNPAKARLREGKHLAGAEFCAPLESMYGHVRELAEKADYIFLPVFLESRERSGKMERNYCYYTQFSPSIVSQIDDGRLIDRFIVPEMDFSRSARVYIKELQKSLEKVFGDKYSYADISAAWVQTEKVFHEAFENWRAKFELEFSPGREISVVLLGRPYIILSPELNKNIPEYFSRHDIKCFFQDMLPAGMLKDKNAREILRKVPWHFAAGIMGAAEYISHTPGLYPVLVTAFKCAPDSFIIEFFKEILEARNKPYLILQIDEHDSGVGYETRIEAALRSFRNHAETAKYPDVSAAPMIFPRLETKINGRTLLLPNWDSYSNRLMVAMLQHRGIDARLLEPDETSMRQSMAHNKGQCIPINMIAQDFIEYVIKYDLDPSKTMLWMSRSFLTCNFRMYPEFLKHLLDNHGNGMEKADVYLGQISNLDLSLMVAVNSYFVYMLGGLIRKISCMTRPCELEPGRTDRVVEDSLQLLEKAFRGEGDLESAVRKMSAWFNGIALEKNLDRPEVAIFGDFYVRDHEVVNQNLIRFIENAGAMVVTTPYHDYVKLQSENVIRRAYKRGDYSSAVMSKILLSLLDVLDRKYYRHLENMLGMKEKINTGNLVKHLDSFNVKPYHSGESYDNLLKIFHILEYHPKLSLFVQTNPAFCCPALITEAMTRQIKSVTGVPVVTVTYDGTSESKNEIILPYLLAVAEKMDHVGKNP
jgi:predicted CoA-substrate-specific enzyme activase